MNSNDITYLINSLPNNGNIQKIVQKITANEYTKIIVDNDNIDRVIEIIQLSKFVFGCMLDYLWDDFCIELNVELCPTNSKIQQLIDWKEIELYNDHLYMGIIKIVCPYHYILPHCINKKIKIIGTNSINLSSHKGIISLGYVSDAKMYNINCKKVILVRTNPKYILANQIKIYFDATTKINEVCEVFDNINTTHTKKILLVCHKINTLFDVNIKYLHMIVSLSIKILNNQMNKLNQIINKMNLKKLKLTIGKYSNSQSMNDTQLTELTQIISGAKIVTICLQDHISQTYMMQLLNFICAVVSEDPGKSIKINYCDSFESLDYVRIYGWDFLNKHTNTKNITYCQTLVGKHIL